MRTLHGNHNVVARRVACRIILLLLVLFSTAGMKGMASRDTLVDAAWRAWEAPDYALAEQQFLRAIAADPANERARIGLALLYSQREEPRKCWEALRPLEGKSPHVNAFAFSLWHILRFSLKDEYEESGVLDFLLRLADHGDDRGVIAAQTTEALEEYYIMRNELSTSRVWRERMNAISDWLLIGPFENVSASGYDKVFPPENEFVPTATYDGKRGIPASWFPIASSQSNTWIDFMKHFPYKQSIYYANTFIYAPAAMPVQLRVGTSGSLRAFLNDSLVIECFDENNNDLDTYITATRLQQGWNRLLIKCGCSEIDRCNFLVRITDEHGARINGLRVSTALQAYLHKPPTPSQALDNAFETYYKSAIAASPDWPENYALLADFYLRDDKAPQAELVLRTALKKWPRCALFYTLMMETYTRGEKRNEVDELLEKLSSLDAHLPAVLTYRIAESLRNEEFQAAESYVAALKEQHYNPAAVYNYELEILAKRKEINKLATLNSEALAQFPLQWEFVNLQAVIESEINRDPMKSAEVVHDFLKRKYGVDQLSTLASCYLKAGKFDEWEHTMREAVELSPTATGYFYTMGQVFQLVKAYAKAEEMYRKCIALCPNSSLYWAKLAEVLKATGRTPQAVQAYRSGLTYEPRDFDARDALRELEGKPPIFSSFPSYPIDSLVHAAPTHALYENDNSIILLDDTRRVVFEKGASMVAHEFLVKVFTARGIDGWKEYHIPYNSYNEELTVEKAVTLKKDGTEVKADVRDGDIVFKSLEADECVYVKWKVKNFYNGMLAQHFWDTHYCDGFIPTCIDRYALMVPHGTNFSHRTQFTPDAPVVVDNGEGILYDWQWRNVPAIRYEEDMPGINDVGKILFVSSLPSWDYVAQWYSDLARTKTRSTFEIKEEVDRLLPNATATTDEQRVKSIYDFITEHIRYSSVSFRQSAYIPQRARDVLVQRLGDCKDVSTLCIAMLNEVGIKAHYVLTNTWNEGANRNILPSIAFNHCIVGVDLKDGVRYLDLTASNFSLGTIPPVVNGAFSLAITDSLRRPMYLASPYFGANKLARTTKAVLQDDNSITVECLSHRSGPFSAEFRARYRSLSQADRIKHLTEVLSKDYPNLTVDSFTAKDLDRLDPSLDDSRAFTVPHWLSDAGGYKVMRLPWSDKLTATQALAYSSRTYPLILTNADDSTAENLSVTLPKGYRLQEIPKPRTLSTPFGTYKIEYKFAQGALTAKRLFVSRKPAIPADEYVLYKEFYNAALQEDNRQMLLKPGK
jgi:tetratricopeptide (TPR) repeat protein